MKTYEQERDEAVEIAYESDYPNNIPGTIRFTTKMVYSLGFERAAQWSRKYHEKIIAEKNAAIQYWKQCEQQWQDSDTDQRQMIEKLEKALSKAEQYMVTTNLYRARSRGDYQALSDALTELAEWKNKAGS